MSDSLRDQLLKAGFTQPKKDPPEKRNPRRKAAQNKNRTPPANKVVDKAAGNTANAGNAGPAPQQSAQSASHSAPAEPARRKKKKSKKAPAIKPRAGSWSTKGKDIEPDPTEQPGRAHDQSEPQVAQPQSAVMSEVEKLIQHNAIATYKGDQAYRYTMQDRIREIHVTGDIRNQLSKSLLAITWIRGATFLIPAATVSQIHEIEPRWVLFLADADPAPAVDQDGADYGDFQVPDDLIW